ncbi:MAG: sigma-70 family RNA polymerase sigma factor [Eubacterium sp.]|nr:sigma-70 family RNA polymerase sigma factor [Eubacterium sp.]MDE6156447.1 sigma-70 family RNA polymerase sigma factor [Eubacterium sp.]MDE6766894.1 sigma-70 family RNA polymerase sigma factor [Eubacterium sp.]
MRNDEYIKAVKRNSNRLYLIALSYLQNHHNAEDVMQDTLLKLWKTNKVFSDDEHMDKWLTITCVHKCKDHFKSPFVKSNVALDEAKELYTFDTIKNYDVFNAIMSLSQKERIVVHLFYYEDMQINEIAEIIKSKPSAVKTRLHRARTHLKAILGDDWINE